MKSSLWEGWQYLILDKLNVDGSTVSIQNANHIRYQNSKVQNASQTGVETYGPTAVGLELLNLNVHNNGSSFYDHGVYIQTPETLFEHCDIHDNGTYGIHVYNGDGDRTDNMIVRHNKVHDSGFANIVGGITLSHGSGIQVYNNLIYHNNIGE